MKGISCRQSTGPQESRSPATKKVHPDSQVSRSEAASTSPSSSSMIAASFYSSTADSCKRSIPQHRSISDKLSESALRAYFLPIGM
jgi:hypothetical protein